MNAGAEALTTRYPTKGLDELCESGLIKLGRGLVISKKDIAACPGPYPIYSSAKENEGKFGEYGLFMFDQEMLTWSVDGGGRFFHRKKHKFSVTNVGGTLRISDTDRLDYRFLYFMITYLQGMIPFDWVLKAHPSVIRKLYRQIPLPPLDEQRRIVAVLDKAFAGIATATANAQKNLTNARALFESELDAEILQVQAQFAGKPLGDACERITVGHVGPMKTRYFASGIPFLRSQNVRPFKLALDNVLYIDEAFDAELKKSRLQAGDVAVVRTGYPGTAAVVPESLTSANCADLVIIRPSAALNPHYLAAILNSNTGKISVAGKLNGAAQKHFNVGAAKKMKVAIPPLVEQRRIVDRIELIDQKSQSLAQVYEIKLAALTELKQSLLQKAFAGELT